MGPEGLSARGKKAAATLRPGGRREAAQKRAANRFFGKDDGLTTEAPENPGSFSRSVPSR